MCARVPTRNISQDVERFFLRGLYPSSLFPTSLCGVLVPHIFVWGSCSSVMHSCDSRPLPSTRRLLSRTTLSHTTLSHTHRHTHTTSSHTTLSHNSVTQHCHTQLCHTQLSHKQLCYTQLFHIQLCHTHTHIWSHTHNLVTHTQLCHAQLTYIIQLLVTSTLLLRGRRGTYGAGLALVACLVGLGDR